MYYETNEVSMDIETYDYADYLVTFNLADKIEKAKITNLMIDKVEYIPNVGVINKPIREYVESFLRCFYCTDNVYLISDPIITRLSCGNTELLDVSCEQI